MKKYKLTNAHGLSFVVQADWYISKEGWLIFHVPPQGGPSREISRFNTPHIISVERL